VRAGPRVNNDSVCPGILSSIQLIAHFGLILCIYFLQLSNCKDERSNRTFFISFKAKKLLFYKIASERTYVTKYAVEAKL
jgi:hypothetical protein